MYQVILLQPIHGLTFYFFFFDSKFSPVPSAGQNMLSEEKIEENPID